MAKAASPHNVKISTDRLQRIIRNIPGNSAAMLEEMAEYWKQEARIAAPKDTTALEHSIDHYAESPETQILKAGGESEGFDVIVDYGLYQEFGTSNMAAQPFFIPSLRKLEQNIHLFAKAAKKVATD